MTVVTTGAVIAILTSAMNDVTKGHGTGAERLPVATVVLIDLVYAFSFLFLLQCFLPGKLDFSRSKNSTLCLCLSLSLSQSLSLSLSVSVCLSVCLSPLVFVV